MTVLITRRELIKALKVNHHAGASYWLRKAKLEMVERHSHSIFFDACELLAFFEQNKYLKLAANLRQWIEMQEVPNDAS